MIKMKMEKDHLVEFFKVLLDSTEDVVDSTSKIKEFIENIDDEDQLELCLICAAAKGSLEACQIILDKSNYLSSKSNGNETDSSLRRTR